MAGQANRTVRLPNGDGFRRGQAGQPAAQCQELPSGLPRKLSPSTACSRSSLFVARSARPLATLPTRSPARSAQEGASAAGASCSVRSRISRTRVDRSMFRRRASLASLRNSSFGNLTDSAFMAASYFTLLQIAIRNVGIVGVGDGVGVGEHCRPGGTRRTLPSID